MCIRIVQQIAQLRGAVHTHIICAPIIQMNHAREDAGILSGDLGIYLCFPVFPSSSP